MLKPSVCLLICNSARLLVEVLSPLLRAADECIIVDLDSTDGTVSICQQFGLTVHHHAYKAHGAQMNYAIGLASHDWMLCMDSDEILGNGMVAAVQALKMGREPDPTCARRLPHCWFVLSMQVRTIYPIFSPDYPMRLLNRQQARFDDRPVDDQVVGHTRPVGLSGFVCHGTFYSLHEVFNKLNSYTTRLVKYQQIKPSLTQGIVSAIGAFFKWCLFSGAWRYGKIGVVTGLYAMSCSFLKYLKAWYAREDNQVPIMQKRTDP